VVPKIIVGVDATAHSEDAVAFARELHDATRVPVILACAYPYSTRLDRPTDPALRDALEAEARETVKRHADAFGADAETRTIPDASPARALHELAEDEGAALLVVGSSHRSRVGQVLVGSTAMRLIHGAPCAVAVVPSGYRVVGLEPRFDQIGCAFDWSAEADVALDVAAAAARTRHATLRVIRAFDPADYGSPALIHAPGSAYPRTDLERRAREEVKAAIDALAADVRAEPVLEGGPAAEVLAAESARVDLLFVGSRGYGPHRAVLAGSVVQRLLRNAECPVVVLPRGVEQKLGATFARDARSSAR
jgi:nucleotide-binding universal stress UspA family protein